jgi:hypothetical protein
MSPPTTPNSQRASEIPSPSSSLLDEWNRRLTVYLFAQELFARGAVADLGARELRAAEFLVARGAARAVCVGRDVTPVSRGAAELHAALPTASGLPDGEFDAVLLLDADPKGLPDLVAEGRRLLRPEGTLVVGCRSRDLPGATSGISYYELLDLLEAQFGAVKMLGQASFVGATLVEYGVSDPDPVLDSTLVPKGERVEWYLAVATGRSKPKRTAGYTVIQVPRQALVDALRVTPGETKYIAAAPAHAGTGLAEAARPKEASLPSPSSTAPVPGLAELRAELEARKKGIVELKELAALHAAEMKRKESELRERDAYIAELERDRGQIEALRTQAAEANARAERATEGERDARRRLAEAEGKLLRLGVSRLPTSISGPAPGAPGPGAAPQVPAPLVPGASSAPPVATPGGDLEARLRELEAENRKLREREADARSESWKHLKARSEAEAQAAEVREDTVRKLKDARKLASVELMRAMEEATKKAVTLREELARSEKERKEALADLRTLKEELEAVASRTSSHTEEPIAHLEATLIRAREESEAAVEARERAERNLAEETVARRAAEAAVQLAGERIEAQRNELTRLEQALKESREHADAERARSTQLEVRLSHVEAELAERAAAGQERYELAVNQASIERGRLEWQVAELEREAHERAAQNAQSLREVEGLRRELVEREARLSGLERERGQEIEELRRELAERDLRLRQPTSDVTQIETELERTQRRVQELSLELERREMAVERAAASAVHERSRAERLLLDERRAVSERSEARAQLVEAESRLAAMEADRKRAQMRAEFEAERALRAENEVRAGRERLDQLSQALERAERRAEEVVSGSEIRDASNGNERRLSTDDQNHQPPEGDQE